MVDRAVFLLETLGDQASPCLFQLLESAFKPAVLEHSDVCFHHEICLPDFHLPASLS